MIPKLTYQQLLYYSFYQITLYAQKDISVMTAIIEALSIIGELGDSDINQELLIFSAYIIARIDENDLLRMD